MSPLAWMITFGIIGLLSVVGLLGIGWYARRAMAEHQRQVKEILTEMQQVMQEEAGAGDDTGDDEDDGAAVEVSGPDGGPRDRSGSGSA